MFYEMAPIRFDSNAISTFPTLHSSTFHCRVNGLMFIHNSQKCLRLPDFLVIGAARSGTTSLYYYLSQHPNIFLPDRKEPQFLSYRNVSGNYKEVITDLDEYTGLFPMDDGTKVLGEASTSYLYLSGATIKSIKELYGASYKKLKIIAILRNPTERTYSHYLFMTKQGLEKLPFENAINADVVKRRQTQLKGYDYIGHSLYYENIKAYMQEFPNMKIYIDSDLKDTNKLVKDLFEYLEVDPAIKVRTNIQTNPSGIPKSTLSKIAAFVFVKQAKRIKRYVPNSMRIKLIFFRDAILKSVLTSPEMNVQTRAHLHNLFGDDVLKLQRLIGRDLSHWLD